MRRERIRLNEGRVVETHYGPIFDAADDAILVHDARTGKILDANQKATEMYGYTREEARCLTVQMLISGEPPYTRKEALRRLAKAAAGEPQRFEWLAKDESGRAFWVEVSIKHVAIGGADRLLAIVRDITERKQAEVERERLLDKLREVNERLIVSSLENQELAQVARKRASELQAVLDNMVDGVFACDRTRRITLVNETGVRLLGLTSVEEPRLALAEFPSLFRVRHLDGRPVVAEDLPLARALAGQTVLRQDEVVGNQQTGRDTYLRVNAAPIRGESGEIVGAVEVLQDVTELSELDRQRSQFVDVAAHELKTPVAIMRGYAETLLRSGADLSPHRRRMLEAIDRGAGRIDGIVMDLLDLSRLHLGHLNLALERVDLVELVSLAVDRIALITSKHQVRLLSAVPVVVQGDRDRLEEVILTLLDNAIRYSPEGGDVDVRVALRGGDVVVSVTDQGIGIPKEKQAHIFERFYRAHNGTPYDYGGLGAGLYIAYEVVKRLGGRMWFRSEEGKGSTFCLSLPIAQA